MVEFGTGVALDGLEAYSHAWLLFEFHGNTDHGFRGAKVAPPRGYGAKVGWLATRSPHRAVWNSNLQPDFNVRICDSFDASSSAVLRELDKSNRFVQKSAESTSI